MPYFQTTPGTCGAGAACLGAWSHTDTAWLRGREGGYITKNRTPTHSSSQHVAHLWQVRPEGAKGSPNELGVSTVPTLIVE